MAKETNPHGKTVKAPYKENAYAVYTDQGSGWAWYVLKTYQAPAKAQGNQYARAFCLVTSPIVGESGELGDVYLRDIHGTLTRGADIRGSHAGKPSPF